MELYAPLSGQELVSCTLGWSSEGTILVGEDPSLVPSTNDPFMTSKSAEQGYQSLVLESRWRGNLDLGP